jgi:hypothetical protein
LNVAFSLGARHVASLRPATDKSFLVLFFKKELLPLRLPSFGSELL